MQPLFEGLEVILERLVRVAVLPEIATQRCDERTQPLVFHAELLCAPVTAGGFFTKRRNRIVQNLELPVEGVVRRRF
ncbi:MAG TPA: hypothetical protein VLF14_01865 [Candidatus Binatia bacterium]|nr:hypothetical protein [Candidatus Binatia bacterium]